MSKKAYQNLIGQTFTNLYVIRMLLTKINSRALYKCRCICGKIITVKSNNLISKHTKSCGCLIKQANIKHNMSYSKFYFIWQSMKTRCNNPNYNGYKHYGNRGITYDIKWEKFINFYNDMYFKYIYAKRIYGEKCLSIERKDVNGNYCFDNCIFIPKSEQSKNRRNGL